MEQTGGKQPSVRALVEAQEPDWQNYYESVTEAAVDLGLIAPPRVRATARTAELDFHDEAANWERLSQWHDEHEADDD